MRCHYPPLQWPKVRTLTTSNAGKDEEQQELSFVASGNATGCNTVENSLMTSYEIKHTLNIRSSNFTPCSLPKGAENLCLHKNLHTDVYSSLTHNCQKVKATKFLFSR
jgi:hypothetical protein